MVAVDPTVLSKQEYQDVCGLDFDQETMEQRLQATNYLYPQHVQVISELEPVAQEMVDDVVRRKKTMDPNHTERVVGAAGRM